MKWLLVTYVLTAALRDRLVFSLFILLGLGVSLSLFLGSAAVIEKSRFALVFAGGGLRMACVMGLVLFVVFFIRRSFESKDVELLLTRPVSRVGFLLSYSAGFSLLALLMGLAQGLCIYGLAPHAFGEGAMLWTASIIAENIIMVNVAMFFAMVVSSSASAAMVTFSFYLLARLMGQILGVIDAGTGTRHEFEILKIIMQGISAVTPRLDLMGQTSWLIYGLDAQVTLGYVFTQGLVFTVFILLASLIDLVRRQF